LAIGEYVDEHGVLVNNGLDLVNEVGVARTGQLVGLKFMPDLVRIASVGSSQPVQVYEYYSDGSLGRDVTADPALQLTSPKNADWTAATGGGKLLVGKLDKHHRDVHTAGKWKGGTLARSDATRIAIGTRHTAEQADGTHQHHSLCIHIIK